MCSSDLQALGEPVEHLTPAQAQALMPGLNVGDVVAAVYGPRDGRLDPHGLVRAWRHRLRHARLQTGVTVLALGLLTALYGVLDTDSGRLTYANAGHNRPLLRTAAGEIQELPANGIALGVLANIDLEQRSLLLDRDPGAKP